MEGVGERGHFGEGIFQLYARTPYCILPPFFCPPTFPVFEPHFFKMGHFGPSATLDLPKCQTNIIVRRGSMSVRPNLK